MLSYNLVGCFFYIDFKIWFVNDEVYILVCYLVAFTAQLQNYFIFIL